MLLFCSLRAPGAAGDGQNAHLRCNLLSLWSPASLRTPPTAATAPCACQQRPSGQQTSDILEFDRERPHGSPVPRRGRASGTMAGAIRNLLGAATGDDVYGRELTATLKRTYAEVNMLEKIPPSKQITVEFANLSAWVVDFVALQMRKNAVGMKKKGSDNGPPAEKQILHSLSGVISPGEVLALMGPSGSGKTSLLSAVAGRAKFSKMEGAVTFNGSALTKGVKRRIGFVLQDDLLFESLTVFETLYFAAMLRLPQKMPKKQKLDRVETVLKALGLVKCRSTIVGGYLRRGVSGGERKRVSIGHELLINPSVLLLDEPTSGLDATTALKLVHTLKVLAMGGRSIITTIHQPSSRMYHELDKLLLLAEGHAIYHGDAHMAAQYFESVGYKVPFGVNVADFMLDLASGDIASDARGPTYFADEWSKFLEAPNSDAKEKERRRRQGFAESAAKRAARLQDIADHHGDSKSSQGTRPGTEVDVESGHDEEEGHGTEVREGANWTTQFSILIQRFIKVRRFEALSIQRFMQIAIVGILTGLFWWQRGHNKGAVGISDTLGLLFFEMLFMSLSTMFTALFTFPSEFRTMLKERASGMYRLSAFYLARISADIPLDCFYPTIFVLIVYWFGGLRATPTAFFSNYFTVILLLLVAQSYGLLLGAAVMNAKTAQTIATILILAFMLTAGFYVSNIPVWISWVKFIGFIYYGYNLLIYYQYQGLDLPDWPSGYPKPSELIPIRDSMVLLGMLVVLRLIIYYVLKQKTQMK